MISPKKTKGSHVSAAPGNDPRMSTILSTLALIGRERIDLKHRLQPWVGPEPAADLRGRQAVRQDDVRGEVVLAADQRRADPVGVDGNTSGLELADALGVEPSGNDDLDPLEARFVERVAHLAHEPLVHAAGVEVAHVAPAGAVDERPRGVQSHPPEAVAKRAGDL